MLLRRYHTALLGARTHRFRRAQTLLPQTDAGPHHALGLLLLLLIVEFVEDSGVQRFGQLFPLSLPLRLARNLKIGKRGLLLADRFVSGAIRVLIDDTGRDVLAQVVGVARTMYFNLVSDFICHCNYVVAASQGQFL